MSKVCISFVLVGAVYVIYWKGPVLRANSAFAQQLAGDRNDRNDRRSAANSAAPSRAQSLSKTHGGEGARSTGTDHGGDVEKI